MNKPSVYLDTSVINFLFADDAPERQEITTEFFANFVRLGLYDVCVSEYVVDEIQQTPDRTHRQRLLQALEDNYVTIHLVPDAREIGALAEHYLRTGILPPAKLYDALHVAYCTVWRIDYLVSWNYKHLANVNRERRILALNNELGYLHPFRIITPSELTGYGD